MDLCRYRNVLGVPREGVHKARFLSMASNDWIMTLIASCVLAALMIPPWLHPRSWAIMFLVMLISIVGLGIVLHRLFCVRTTVDRWLFPDLPL